MSDTRLPTESVERKPYIRPQIIHELELETRAGSPLGIDLLDLEGTGLYDH